MRTNEERIALAHERASVLRRRREKMRLAASGSFSLLLFAALTGVMFRLIGMSPIDSCSRLTGASLLGEGAGGYVIVAVISFFAAVFITAFLLKRQAKKK